MNAIQILEIIYSEQMVGPVSCPFDFKFKQCRQAHNLRDMSLRPFADVFVRRIVFAVRLVVVIVVRSVIYFNILSRLNACDIICRIESTLTSQRHIFRINLVIIITFDIPI